jgi:hypothetical protein
MTVVEEGKMTIRIGIMAKLVATATLVASAPSWNDFWHSIKIDPPPPASFLDPPPFNGKILNLTTGRLSDTVVKQWIEADLRRGAADGWIGANLRRDIADAGIFGPAGLNGTSEGIDNERARGVKSIESDGYSETVAAAVIWVSKEDQRENSSAGYTDYVIVHVRRMTGRQRTRVFQNGTREAIVPAPKAGKLRWQMDSGHFFTHPVLGPLWYQQAGWRCDPDDGARMGEICGRVRP